MSTVRLSSCSFSYSDAVPLLDGVSLHLSSGWFGVIGPNGAGKSTFLGLLSADLLPTQGSVRWDPPGRVVCCPQRVEQLTGEITDLAAAWDRQAVRWRKRLGLEPEGLTRWPTLSPGERKRWQIAAALWLEPVALLLDEPTNHLDVDSRAVVLGALRRFSGLGVVVSHDRALLDELTGHTIRIRGGQVQCFPGPYGAARDHWEQETRAAMERRDALGATQRALRRRLGEKRKNRAGAARKLSARARMKGPRDSDARSVNAKTRVAKAEARLSRQVAVARQQLERAQAQHVDVGPPDLGRSVFVDYQSPRKSTLFHLEADEVRAGEVTLLREVRLSVGRDARVWIRGPNGVGKTTLLNALLETTTVGLDKVLFLPQVLSEREAERAVAAARELDRTERGRLCQLLAALGVEPVALLASARPSPGEARKLLLAMALSRHAVALVLDEPTNHLDLPSIERLEQALRAYPGAILLISHDERFAQAVTQETWDLRQHRVMLRRNLG